MAKIVTRFIVQILALLFGGCLLSSGVLFAGDKYAVIVVAEHVPADPTPVVLGFWNGAVLTYDMLRENGFQPDHIIVLYGQGESVADYTPTESFISAVMPRDSRYADEQMSDRLATGSEIQRVFQCLAEGSTEVEGNGCDSIPKLSEHDFLFVFWTGHGRSPVDNVRFEIGTSPGYISSQDLKGWMNNMRLSRRVFLFTTCRAAGITSYFGSLGTNTVVMPACIVDEEGGGSHSVIAHLLQVPPTGATVRQFDWTYWVAYALSDVRPPGISDVPDPDYDENSLVSIEEADRWAKAQQPNPTPPDITDKDTMAPCIFIRTDRPGEGVQLFSRDHENDGSTVPSNTEPWYHGPDLWVRHNADGVPVHENPRYDSENFVYARVHNIGCSGLDDVKANLSWSYPSGWMDQSSWNPIGASAPVRVAKGTSVTLPPVQWGDVPVPGSYCLHLKLEAPGDMPNTHGEAFLDNNKVQVNVSVMGVAADEPAMAFFFVENRADGTRAVDLEFDLSRVPEGARIEVEFPPTARFRGIFGGSVRRTGDGWTVLELGPQAKAGIPVSTTRLARVTGLRMAGRSRIRALLSISVPHGPQPRRPVELVFEEVVDGETKGGIRFVAVPFADVPESLCEVIRVEARLFRNIADRLGLEGAGCMADGLEAISSPRRCGGLTGLREVEAVGRACRKRLIQALMEVAPIFGSRFAKADHRLNLALSDRDVSAAVSAEQARLLYASIILDELQSR